MRSILLLGFIILPVILIAQEIPPDLLKKMEETGKLKNLTDSFPVLNYTARKGRIVFTNGEKARFTSLQLKGDSVYYGQSGRIMNGIALSAVNQIDTLHRHTAYNAVIGGAVGLASGLLIGLLAYPEDNTLATLIEIIFNDENSDGPKLSKKAIPLIVGSGVAGSLLGAFVITSKNDRKILYKRNISVSFVPEIPAGPDVHTGYMLTARIRF